MPRIIITSRGLFLVKSRKRRLKKKNEDYIKYKEQARKLIHQRLAFFSQVYNFHYNKVAIRDQRSRWGSCSKNRNLNFNYRLIHLPADLRDYVIVHEMCHLKEFNHGRDFWKLVAISFPHYKELRASLKTIILRNSL